MITGMSIVTIMNTVIVTFMVTIMNMAIVTITIMVTMMIIRPVLALLLVYLGLGIYGAWIAIAADQLTRTALVFARYRQGKWMQIRLKSEEMRDA